MFDELQAPQPGGGTAWDVTTPAYVDTYVALELLHMRYPDYIAQVPALERLFYQLYLSLKSGKERHAQETAHQQAEIERQMVADTPQGRVRG